MREVGRRAWKLRPHCGPGLAVARQLFHYHIIAGAHVCTNEYEQVVRVFLRSCILVLRCMLASADPTSRELRPA